MATIPELEFDFKSQADKLLLFCKVVEDGVDLNQITELVTTAHTIGPFIDPTRYRDALYSGNMDAIRDLAEAMKEPMRIFRERILPRVEPL